MTVPEMETALEGMVVLVDTREQDTPALRQRIAAFGPWEREKLDAGDYSARFPLPDGSWYRLPVAVERKMSFDELCACYCRERKRFRAEFDRARAAGIKLYLLVEGGSWEGAYAGAYRSRMAPRSLVGSMLAWLARYGCQLIFCQRYTTGRLVRDILYREGREALMGMVDDG